MAARGGAMLHVQLQSYNWAPISNEFNQLRSKIELGQGRLRAVSQGYSYSYTKIELVSNFQWNSLSW